MRGMHVWAYYPALPCHNTRVRNDYIMASVNTQIYMVLMENIAILLTSMQRSAYTRKPHMALLVVFI